MKALVVDSDATRRAAVGQALRAGGIDVTEASSGSFALTMLEWNRHDVILSRSRIDDMEGLELCGILRADPTTRAVLFVLMADAGESVPADTTGIDLVLPDGVAGAAILPMVVQLLQRDPEPSTSGAAPRAVAPAANVARPPAPSAARPPAPVMPAPPVAAPPPVSVAPPPAATSPDIAPAPARIRPITAAPGVANPPPVVATRPVTMPPHLDALPGTAPKARLGARGSVVPPTPAAATPRVPPTPPPSVGVPSTPAAPAPKPTPRPAAAAVEIPARTFQGSLGLMEMEELVQAIAVGHKTGRLLIVLAAGGGMIAFESGRVIHAEFGKRSGTEAFETLVTSAHREGSGKFCFIPGDGTALANLPRTISASTDQLLLTIATAMDEKKK